MRVGILGGGITGLTAARLLHDRGVDYTVYERGALPGGIARVRDVEGIPYHLVGGHCFNSKYANMVEFVDQSVMPISEFHHIERVARIAFKGHLIGYPIELSLRDIAAFDAPLATRMLEEAVCAEGEPASDLAAWFANNFGPTLAAEYFNPYNRKIWGVDPATLIPDWVRDKLPQPDRREILRGVFGGGEDVMPHRTFYYPKTGTQNTMIDRLAAGLSVRYETAVERIEQSGGRWCVNGEDRFDHLISTLPLDRLHHLLDGGETIAEPSSRLRYNKVSNVLWETTDVGERTWTYVPTSTSITHRHVHIGKFLRPIRNFTITETIGDVPAERIIEDCKQFDYLLRPVDSHVSAHAYVVFDHDYKDARAAIFGYLDEIGLQSVGRFGEWEYYNMDICMKRAAETVDALLQ